MRLTKQQKIEKEQLAKQGLKQCPSCPTPKPLSDFHKDKSRKDGLKCVCKEHRKEYNDKPEVKTKLAKYKKDYREQPENKKKATKYGKEFRENNKEEISKKATKYRDKPEVKARINIGRRNRRKTNINFRLSCNLRIRINQALKGNSKSKKSNELLGCTIKELKNHIESQFTKGMSWDNHGRGDKGKKEWHIDHIKPCALFDLRKKSEQLKCFNFKNLQPLWAEDNLRKSVKY